MSLEDLILFQRYDIEGYKIIYDYLKRTNKKK